MNKIITTKQVIRISQKLHDQNKTIVLAGGCFDIVHIGHIAYLTKAKEQGDILIVLLESDKTIKKIKGDNRPFHTQKERATILSALQVVDYVVLLPFMKNDKNYDSLVFSIKPAIIAATKADPQEIHKQRQAKTIHAQVINVVERINDSSTSKLAKLLYKDI